MSDDRDGAGGSNFIFGEREKLHFHIWMRKLEKFCGVQVVTYCLMSNHFHLLVRVPEKSRQEPLTEASLRELLPCIYTSRALRDITEELDRATAQAAAGSRVWLQEILDRFEARRFDLSVFLRELKFRFSSWYNRRNDRCGALWESRFTSVLVEGGEQALLTMAAYIDLNPLRAGIVCTPDDYRWSGYGESMAGDALARHGLGAILKCSNFATNRKITWSITGPRYRMLLYAHGEERAPNTVTGKSGRMGLRRETVEAELKRGGKVSVGEILRCKVRYFSAGAVFGSSTFVESVFEENRELFGAKRTTGARRMHGAEWGDLRVARDLQENRFS